MFALAKRRRMLAVKRATDVVGAAVMIVLLAPIFLAITLAILLSDGRPIFYRQARVGRHGSLFTMLKFRTMVTDAHERRHEIAQHNERAGPLFKMTHDPRVTRIGGFLRRSSLDELPQLFNVLFGTMSLVGPRPCLPEERESFSEELRQRELMPQGMTGLWQVGARDESDFSRYEALDLEYVRTWSFGRDLSILLRTPVTILRHARPTAAAAGAAHGGEDEIVLTQVVDGAPGTVTVAPFHAHAPAARRPVLARTAPGPMPQS